MSTRTISIYEHPLTATVNDIAHRVPVAARHLNILTRPMTAGVLLIKALRRGWTRSALPALVTSY